MKLAVALASASFFMLGACVTLPGMVLPLLLVQFDMRLVEAGSMLALQPIAYLLSVLVAGRLLARFSMRAVLRASVGTFAAGIAGFALTSTWLAGAALLFASGLGFGVMEVALNTLLVTIGGERRSNLLNFSHLFFGVGSFVAPALTAQAVAAGVAWRVPFAVAGGITALVAAGWSFLRVHTDAPSPTTSDSQRAPAYTPLTLLLAVLLGVYVGVETGIGGWLTKYMVSVRDVSLAYGGNTLSLYWLGLAAGRLVLTGLAHHVREERLIVGLAAFATVTAAAALLAAQPWTATAAFALTGLGFSGIFPAVIALGGRHHPHNTAAATSVLIAGAGLGGIVIPWTMSAIADGVGLVAGMSFYVLLSGAMAALAAGLLQRLRHDDRAR
jgi:fucose permease